MLANQSFDMDEITNMAMRQIVDLFRADTAAVYLFDKEREAAETGSQLSAERGTCWMRVNSRFPMRSWQYTGKPKDRTDHAGSHGDVSAQVAERLLAEGMKEWIWVADVDQRKADRNYRRQQPDGEGHFRCWIRS